MPEKLIWRYRVRLIIRKKQMAEFDQIAFENMQRRIRETMQRMWPEKCNPLPDQELAQLVNDAIDTGWSYGLLTEGDLLRFVNLSFTLGFDFPDSEQYPWATEILHDYELSPEQILDRIWGVLEPAKKA